VKIARPIQRTTVRLTGIALRHQGSHDSLCAYYAAAMLLCALRPELEPAFEAPHVDGDPLFANLPRRRGRTTESVAAEWLASGVALAPLARALSRAAATTSGRAAATGNVRTRFVHRRAPVDGDTLAFLRAQVDAGLPCVIGWESRELGSHTSLVVGYDRHAPRSWFLRLLDPIRVQEQLEWRQLARLSTEPLELVHARLHDGIRPDKLTLGRDAAGVAVESRLERWHPGSGWRTLY
jgi:hypothetical protein